MSRIKADAKQVKCGTLNTTIDDDVLVTFKSHCKELGLPMSVLIQGFMSQFVDGEFVFKFGKANRILVDIEEEKQW